MTGYPEAFDWTGEELHPDDDGVFAVNAATAGKRLLVSFRQTRDALVERHPRIDKYPLFIDHALWNRDGDRLHFYVRGNFRGHPERIDDPMTVTADGTGLVEQRIFIGGHPEWELGARMIGTVDRRLLLYDSERQHVVERLGGPGVLPGPGNDVVLSPDGNRIVPGREEGSRNSYVVYRRSDGARAHSEWFDQPQYDTGNLRIDAAPKWNRASDGILFSSLTNEAAPTGGPFLARIIERPTE